MSFNQTKSQSQCHLLLTIVIPPLTYRNRFLGRVVNSLDDISKRSSIGGSKAPCSILLIFDPEIYNTFRFFTPAKLDPDNSDISLEDNVSEISDGISALGPVMFNTASWVTHFCRPKLRRVWREPKAFSSTEMGWKVLKLIPMFVSLLSWKVPLVIVSMFVSVRIKTNKGPNGLPLNDRDCIVDKVEFSIFNCTTGTATLLNQPLWIWSLSNWVPWKVSWPSSD